MSRGKIPKFKSLQGKFDLDKDGVLPPIDINVGIIPCGSGNGVVHYLTRSFSLDHAVAALVRIVHLSFCFAHRFAHTD